MSAVLGGVLVLTLVAGAVLHHLAGRPAAWMSVNVALALAPVILASVLCTIHRRGPAWWIGVGVLVLLLPNAPYLLTDVIHARADLVKAWTAGETGVAMVGTYVALFVVGIVGYTYVLALVVADLKRHGRARLVRPILAALNAACAVGVWLGRVTRLNSWDASDPRLVAAALARAVDPRAITAIAFVALVVGTAAVALLRLADRAARHFRPA